MFLLRLHGLEWILHFSYQLYHHILEENKPCIIAFYVSTQAQIYYWYVVISNILWIFCETVTKSLWIDKVSWSLNVLLRSRFYKGDHRNFQVDGGSSDDHELTMNTTLYYHSYTFSLHLIHPPPQPFSLAKKRVVELKVSQTPYGR